MTATVKLWELKRKGQEKPVALLESWDTASILAKRLGIEEFTLLPVVATYRLLDSHEVHSPVSEIPEDK